jgi:N-methylhydantoinase A/oxoprolinase/acetone carboxylase beta subunit
MIDPATGESGEVLVGVDVGGTFTDAVVVCDDGLYFAKVPTTPADQSLGVLSAVEAALGAADRAPVEVTRLAQGMTVGTNALLEGKGARTALIATEGFGDVLELRRQTRSHLYRLGEGYPPPLVPRELVVEVRERAAPDGVLVPLTEEEVARVVTRVIDLDVEAVAIGLLFSFAHPQHEAAIAERLRQAAPDLAVSASHEVLPEIREYERISTTVVDAYLTPVIAAYLDGLAERSANAGLPAPAIMQSNGGVIPIDDAARHAAWTVLSGPAGGVVAGGRIAEQRGDPFVLTFDMGGTSCDVALVRDGRPTRAPGVEIAGQPLHLPMLDVQTVSAGGGSIAWRDSGGALRVGPESAGARPGPAAYGHGGTRATVTDANVVLGRIPAHCPLGEDLEIDAGLATAVVAELADELGLSVEETAEGIIKIAVEEMVRALRRVSVERGVDPRAATLVPFGGAGPLHACDVADALGARSILVPPAAGTLAALGLIQAGARRDWVQTVLRRLTSDTDLSDDLEPLVEAARRALPDGRIEFAADCRYVGQSHALTVDFDPDEAISGLEAEFHAAHEEQYGAASRDESVELVSLRVSIQEVHAASPVQGTLRAVDATGPAVIAVDGATLWVAPGWRSSPGPGGSVLLEPAKANR